MRSIVFKSDRAAAVLLFICSCWIAWMPGGAFAESPSHQELSLSEQRLQAHLESLDRAVNRASRLEHRVVAGTQQQERDFLLRHLRALEGLVRSWQTPRTDPWLQALETLRHRLQLGSSGAATDGGVGTIGAITGRLTDAASGDPIPFVEVVVTDSGGGGSQFVFTDADGRYAAEGLAAGSYVVVTLAADFRDEIYDDIPCLRGLPDGCNVAAGTQIPVSVAETVEGIDFALDLLGSISGRVTAPTVAGPVGFVDIEVWDASGNPVGSDLVDESGAYRVGGLSTGTYFVSTRNFEGFREELFDDLPCSGGVPVGCAPEDGTPVAVTSGSETTGIDFALAKLGAISGTVTDNNGLDAVPLADVTAYDDSGAFAGFGTTDGSGAYRIEGLDGGAHFVTAESDNHLGELYDGLPCGQDCDVTIGSPVLVTLDTTTTDIDFDLQRLGSITGTVTASATGEPISTFLSVLIHDADGMLVEVAQVGDFGRYAASGLQPGTHYARMAIADDYIEELYDDIPCPRLRCDPTTGTPLEVALGVNIPGIDFALDPAVFGTLSGRVTDALTGEPIIAANVHLWDANGDFYKGYGLGIDGDFFDDRVEPGTYTATTRAFSDYRDELYDNLPCPGIPPEGCDPTTGTPIVVTAGAVAPEIEFALIPDAASCTPSATVLCLNNGRFRVEAGWQNHQLNTGDGQSVGLTGDTGYFWFFDADNVELVVKVLDACADPFNRFWVFAGGLTDVGVEMTVTDTLTGEVKTYNNPLGSAYQPILDTDAFATCTVGRDAVDAIRDVEEIDLLAAPPSKNLGLNGGRFTVDAVWVTSSGMSATAESVVLTDDTGYFWFFNADNVEVVVKVLDACALPGFNNYWVFAAGLTDVQVTLTVTDSVSGEQQVYFNPLGAPFQPIQDTSAFDTCNSMRP